MHLKNKVLLLHHQNLLSYGVMVTQQILVLLFLVRIQVAQLKSEELSSLFFILSTDSSVSICETPRRPSTANRHCGKNRTADFHNARPHPAAVSKLGAQTSFDFCFPSCLTRRNAVRLYCTGDMKNSSGIVQGAGYTRKSDASGKSVRI